MLPKGTLLGQLEIFEVYEYMDGPKLFATRNNIGTIYLVFWFDEVEDASGWLYLPLSEAKLSKLRRKELSLYAAFSEPETNYYIVYTGVPPRMDSAEPIARTQIDTEYFPPEDFFIEYVTVINEQTDEWSFETILDGINHSAESISQFIGRFRELVESIMNNRNQRTLRLYAKGAVPSSIRIKFNSDDNNEAIEALRIVNELLLAQNEDEFRLRLSRHKVDPTELHDLFSSVLRNKLDVTIAPKLASDGTAFTFPTDRVEQCLEYLKSVNFITVDSIKVPQANDIDKVIEVLGLMDAGTPLAPDSIKDLTTDRQIRYYTDAAYAYGLATKDRQLTSAGHFVISHTNKESQYQILADRFESTDFGWAWMKWAGVEYMTDLDPDTAADFLIASASSLSEVTARRRASTLRHWLTKLQPFHRRYESEDAG